MSSALLVPIPEAEGATSPWWPRWSPAKARGIPAHVTVLFPFLRRSELDLVAHAEIAAAAREVEPFDVVFGRVGRFPSTVYLEPDPADPFIELTRLVVEHFPGHLPYRGTHGTTTVPHLTVLTTPDEDELERAAVEIAASLPIACRVSELWLMVERERGGWELDRTFPLGG